MKKFFYIGIIGLALFEVFKVWFIMPLPGSQEMDTLEMAYFVHKWRWVFRGIFVALALMGLKAVSTDKRLWVGILTTFISLTAIFLFNYKMTADNMFSPPKNLKMAGKAENKLNDSVVVIGVDYNGEARAYPIRFIAFHHQVQDTFAGKPVMITYCNVCRSGRAFEPVVNGKTETFRLVGMDHYNAMFEDETSKTWWRQVNGEAVAGKLKGQKLPEIGTQQMSVAKWYLLHPTGLVMQPDSFFIKKYDTAGRYEVGKSKSKLTRMDSISWTDKSWVLGIQIGKDHKAFAWNDLKKHRTINDQVGETPIFIVLAEDNRTILAFERPEDHRYEIRGNIIYDNDKSYTLTGKPIYGAEDPLKPIQVYQEYWHSWRTFHPGAKRYDYKL